MAPAAIAVWAVMAVFATAADVVMFHRRIAGRMGERVRAHYMTGINRTPGGLYTLAARILMFDIVLPPIGLGICAFACSRDGRWHQDELRRNNALRA
jgi:hypothetical protein